MEITYISSECHSLAVLVNHCSADRFRLGRAVRSRIFNSHAVSIGEISDEYIAAPLEALRSQELLYPSISHKPVQLTPAV